MDRDKNKNQDSLKNFGFQEQHLGGRFGMRSNLPHEHSQHEDDDLDFIHEQSEVAMNQDLEYDRRFLHKPPIQHHQPKKFSAIPLNESLKDSKSLLQMREAEASIFEACNELNDITFSMDTSVNEVMSLFREVEQAFDDALHDMRENNIQILEDVIHEVNNKVYFGLRWKADLSDNLKRIKKSEMDNPEHPINSKLRRKLISL